MRKNFLKASGVGLSLAAAFTCGPASAKKADVHSGHKPPAPLRIAEETKSCTSAQIRNRVRVDGVYDLASGGKIYASMSDADLEATEIHPASLSKLEGIKQVIRNVLEGVWPKTITFRVALRPGDGLKIQDLPRLAQLSLITSFNVLNGVADANFIAKMRAYMTSNGAGAHTNYLSATGDPVTPEIRKHHLTTPGDLLRSIRDWEINYKNPEVLKSVFGQAQISGLWTLDIPGLPRNHHTIKILETATGPDTHPVPGIRDGKSGFMCDSGFGSYVIYHYQNRNFIVLSLGHPTAAARDRQSVRLIKASQSAMADFSPRPSITPEQAVAFDASQP